MFLRHQILFFGFAVLATVSGCGGGGAGTPSGPIYSATVTDTATLHLGPGGGAGSVRNNAVTLPAAMLAAKGEVRLDLLTGLPVGSDTNSKRESGTLRLALFQEPNPSAGAATVSLSVPEPPRSGQAVFVTLLTAKGLRVIPATWQPSTSTVDVLIKPADFTSPQVRTNPTAPNPTASVILTARFSLPPIIPTPRLDLYRFVAIYKRGDDDLYKQDFKVNWTPVQPPNLANKRIALLVHGIFNDLSNLTELASFLKKIKRSDGTAFYDDVYGCDDEYRAGIANTGTKLALLLTEMNSPSTVIDIYAHSQGGLISRYALEQVLAPDGIDSHVQRLFAFGTPHEGVPSQVALELAENGIIDAIWPGIADLVSGSDFLNNLNKGTSKVSTDYVTFKGDDFLHYIFYLLGVEVDFGIIAYASEGVPCDGIVPEYSAAGGICQGIAHSVTRVPTFHLDHSQLKGEFISTDSNDVNLDMIRTQRLIDYIVGGSVNVGIH